MKYFITALYLSVSYLSFACDICTVLDYGSVQNKSYVGTMYRRRVLNGYNNESFQPTFFPKRTMGLAHFSDNEFVHVPSKADYEIYNTYDIRANYNYKNKWNIFVNLPYNTYEGYTKELYNNLGKVKDTTIRYAGFGDFVLAVDKLTRFENETSVHQLKYGVGVGIPLSEFNLYNANGKLVDPTHQPSSGAFSALFRANHILTLNKKFGINQFLNYSMSSTSVSQNQESLKAYDYKFANRFNYQLHAFYSFGIINKIIPQTGIYIESSNRNTLGSQAVTNTGGTSVFYNIGTDLMYKDFIFQALYQHPISQRLNDTQFTTAGRLVFSLTYFFNTSKE